MIISQNLLLYLIGLLAFFAIGYVLAIIQYKGLLKSKTQQTLNSSRNILKGKISEQVALYLPTFPKDLNASEARFLGSPVDFIVFKGMDNKNISEVVFVEVKSGHSRMNDNELTLKKAIDEKRVRYVAYVVPNEII